MTGAKLIRDGADGSGEALLVVSGNEFDATIPLTLREVGALRDQAAEIYAALGALLVLAMLA